MNFTEINHCLTTAINNLAEGEIDVAALAMAEDLEREELEEAKRTKKEQQRIDGLALKKYGMKWRTTPSGSVLGLTRKGKVVAGNPNLLKTLPKEKLSRKAKETMGALKDAPSESGKKGAKTKAINKMLSAKKAKKSPSDKLRAQLAKTKKKMGKSFNAMLMQSNDYIANIQEMDSNFRDYEEQMEYLFNAFDSDDRPRRKKEILNKIFKIMDNNNLWTNKYLTREYKKRKQQI